MPIKIVYNLRIHVLPIVPCTLDALKQQIKKQVFKSKNDQEFEMTYLGNKII